LCSFIVSLVGLHRQYQLSWSEAASGVAVAVSLQAQCTFGPKLTDEEVLGLVQYVQDQAAAGWKQ
jgi:hypothetical protein